jgi:ubiquinone/menaquinone biosynthesis C-methylase UbiE
VKALRGPTLFELVRQGLSSIPRGYDLLAPKFDASCFRTPDHVLRAFERYLRRYPDADSGLDIGCGTGAVVGLLLGVCRKRVVGVDLSAGMLAVARASLASPKLQLVQGDFLSWVPAETFDLATSFGALGHIDPADHPLFLRKVYLALKPGGRFLCAVSDFSGPKPGLYYLASLFDTLMRVRNRVWSPPFVMEYLSFLVDRAVPLMEQAGFQVEIVGGLFEPPLERLKLIICTRET